MTSLLFYAVAISLGFFPYHYEIIWLQKVYHVIVILYAITFSLAFLGIYINKDQATFESAMTLKIPSKTFAVILFSFLGGTTIIYGHYLVCMLLLIVGFSWSMILDWQIQCGVRK